MEAGETVLLNLRKVHCVVSTVTSSAGALLLLMKHGFKWKNQRCITSLRKTDDVSILNKGTRYFKPSLQSHVQKSESCLLFALRIIVYTNSRKTVALQVEKD